MQVQYDTGDHVAVLPENGPETVAAAAAMLGLPLDTVFQLRLPPGNPQQLSLPFPGAHFSSGMLSLQRHQQDWVDFWLLFTILRCGNLQQQVSPPSLGAGEHFVRDSSFADIICPDASGSSCTLCCPLECDLATLRLMRFHVGSRRCLLATLAEHLQACILLPCPLLKPACCRTAHITPAAVRTCWSRYAGRHCTHDALHSGRHIWQHCRPANPVSLSGMLAGPADE